jgi:transposase
LESARERLERLSHLWVDAGYQGRGRRWAQEVLGVSVEVVRKAKKPVPEKVAEAWAQEWAKEGKEVDWQRLMPTKGFQVLPRRWVVERTSAWISATTGGWPKTMKGCAPPRRHLFTRR